MNDGITIRFHPDFFQDLDKHIPVDEQQKFIDDLTAAVHEDLGSGGRIKYDIVDNELMLRHMGSADDIEEFDEFGEFYDQDDENEYVHNCYKMVNKKKLH